MRKIQSLFVALVLIVSITSAQRQCGTTEYMRQELAKNPGWAKNLEKIEEQTQAFILKSLSGDLKGNSSDKGNTGGRGKPTPPPPPPPSDCSVTTSGTITIPVVFHVVYNSNGEKVPVDEILSQLNVLNADFSKTNQELKDLTRQNFEFYDRIGDFNIQFCMAQTDPNGNRTDGIEYVKTKMKSFTTNDAVKFTSKGGANAWNSNNYLNIWLCNLGQGLLGYSTFPGGDPAKDGVVILYSSVPGGTTTNYNLGRTATHEIGHWLNLRHIWGDATCGTDYVDDTPPHKTANYGCPDPKSISCTNNNTTNPYGWAHEMTMNYMDYTYDACMYMFTIDQSLRSRALFDNGAVRQSILCSNGCTAANLVARKNPAEAAMLSNTFKVYPSPASSQLYIELPYANLENKYISVYNITGQQMMQVKAIQNKMKLDISRLQNGVYFIKVGEGEEQLTQRFIKN